MSTTKILVAYDKSEYSKRALDWALNYQRRQGAIIDIVTILPPISNLYTYEGCSIDVVNLQKSKKENIRYQLDELSTECAAKGHKVHALVLEGNIAESLLEYSAKSGAELIVTGTRGTGGFKGLLLGSIAHKLVSYAKIPVVVVK